MLGALGRTRTPNLLIRRQTLNPPTASHWGSHGSSWRCDSGWGKTRQTRQVLGDGWVARACSRCTVPDTPLSSTEPISWNSIPSGGETSATA